MKEVTICFSFSVKDGQTKKFMDSSDIPSGLFGLGTVDTEKLISALRNVYSLLQREHRRTLMLAIESHTLWTSWSTISLDDLKAKNTTHAKGEKL